MIAVVKPAVAGLAALAALVAFGYAAAAVFATAEGRILAALFVAAVVLGGAIMSPPTARRLDAWR